MNFGIIYMKTLVIKRQKVASEAIAQNTSDDSWSLEV